jgi:hypothetical protein
MTIPAFNPRSYTDVSSHPASIRIWSYLNCEELKTKMKTASDLGRPALEAVADDLLAQFEEQFVETNPHRDRFKQMIGAMARQVMESEGYIWVRDNVPLPVAVFSRASKYRHRDAVEFHIWRLSTDPRFVGVTLAKSNEKLPPQQHGEWRYWKRVAGRLAEGMRHLNIAAGIADVSTAMNALKTHGAYATKTQRMMRAP